MAQLWKRRELSWEQQSAGEAVPAGDTSHGSGTSSSSWARDCALACSALGTCREGRSGDGLFKVHGRVRLCCSFQLRQCNSDTL